MFNVINPLEIESYLLQRAAENQALGRLMVQTLMRALMREEGGLTKLSSRPDPAPEWLTAERFHAGEPFYAFRPELLESRRDLVEKVKHIQDWLGAALINQEAWTQDSDGQGRVKALRNIGTLEHANRCADKAMRHAHERRLIEAQKFLTQPPGVEEQEGHIQTIKHNDDGSRWCRLLTPTALDNESAMMGHCIGDGNYDAYLAREAYAYYSLRDATGRAHVTLEVTLNYLVDQCQGKQNKRPVLRYHPHIKALIIEKGWKISESAAGENSGLVQDDDGVIYNIHQIPTDFKGYLDLGGCEDLVALPKILRVSKNLYLRDCINLVSWPETLVVEGYLTLSGCVGLTSIPETWRVEESLILENCINLQSLPDNLTLKRSLNLAGCSRIKTLPKNITLGEELYIPNCTSLESLPENLYVKKDMTLKGCVNLRTLPRKMKVEGKIHTDYGTFSTVEAFRAAFAAHLGFESGGLGLCATTQHSASMPRLG